MMRNMSNTEFYPAGYHFGRSTKLTPPGLERRDNNLSMFTPKRVLLSSNASRSNSPLVTSIIARSYAEQVLFDMTSCGEKPNAGKYRQLPCRTFISTGHCPYKDRCVYLHCPSIRSAFQVSIVLSFASFIWAVYLYIYCIKITIITITNLFFFIYTFIVFFYHRLN